MGGPNIVVTYHYYVRLYDIVSSVAAHRKGERRRLAGTVLRLRIVSRYNDRASVTTKRSKIVIEGGVGGK